MSAHDEEKRLRSVALQNANSILLARQRAEEELVRAKESLELKTRELARTLSRMRATLESTNDAILVTDGRGRVTDFNENFVVLWGLSPQDMVSGEHRHLLEQTSRHFHNPDQFLSRIAEIYASAPPEVFDVLQLADERVIERFSKIQYVDGQDVGRVWSFRDITKHRQAEESLRRSEEGLKLAADEREQLLEAERAARSEAERVSIMKDEFLATLSHELRTPLSAILGWSQLLAFGKSDEAEIRKGLDAIERNARAQTQLIDDLLDMSRIISGKVRLDVQWTDLASVVDLAVESVRPSAEAKQIRLRKIIDPRAGPVSGDPTRLQQIVWNLLTNAIKFTPKGGKVDVLVERVNSHLEVTIHDSGLGIKPEFLPLIFERFRQADSSTTRTHGGLGLGLSIVKNLVELHGGTIHAKSDGESQGATFIVSLPVAAIRGSERREHPTTPKRTVLDDGQLQLAGIRVLVVDDEPDARDLLQRVLGQCDAEVTTAKNAEEALVLVRAQKPDVIVSDIGMPEKDGYQFIREVRNLPASDGGRIPAIALTAFARSEDRTRAMLAGYQVHISKPIEPQELIATVGSLTGRMGQS